MRPFYDPGNALWGRCGNKSFFCWTYTGNSRRIVSLLAPRQESAYLFAPGQPVPLLVLFIGPRALLTISYARKNGRHPMAFLTPQSAGWELWAINSNPLSNYLVRR